MINEKSSPYDLVLVHETLSTMTDEAIFQMLKNIYPERCLYRMSTEWRKDRHYILKAKGTGGDVIIGWIENQMNGIEPLKYCPIL